MVEKRKWRAKRKANPPPPVIEGEKRHPASKLSYKEEEALFWDFINGMSYEEVGGKYSISRRTVHKILSSCRAKIEDRWKSPEPQVEEPKTNSFF